MKKILIILMLSCAKVTNNLRIKNKNINDELVLAIEQNDKDKVLELIKKGANVNTITNIYEITSLMNAAFNGNLELVKILVKKGTNINYKNVYGKTALMYSAKNGCLNSLKFLVESGADIKAKTNLGKTALNYAEKYFEPYALEFLLGLEENY